MKKIKKYQLMLRMNDPEFNVSRVIGILENFALSITYIELLIKQLPWLTVNKRFWERLSTIQCLTLEFIKRYEDKFDDNSFVNLSGNNRIGRAVYLYYFDRVAWGVIFKVRKIEWTKVELLRLIALDFGERDKIQFLQLLKNAK